MWKIAIYLTNYYYLMTNKYFFKLFGVIKVLGSAFIYQYLSTYVCIYIYILFECVFLHIKY